MNRAIAWEKIVNPKNVWLLNLSLSLCLLPPELPHWWGGRRGRSGGGGAILWGAADRDGMGGTRGRETGGVSREATPYALSDHIRKTHPAHHPPTHPHTPTHETQIFFPLFLFFLLVHSQHLSITCCHGLTCACLCWTLPITRFNVVDFNCVIAWLGCRESVQLKTTKWNRGKRKPLSRRYMSSFQNHNLFWGSLTKFTTKYPTPLQFSIFT